MMCFAPKINKDEALKSKEKKLHKKETEIENFIKKYESVIQSKSWRYTHMFRILLKLIKGK
ncbi:hypothetical protein CR194_12725 [Salipaludibacillus keqinensis]|uniref:Uncharacterized protein n=1 Tax=Salipaludibacillus keqinensis TaxID=2045207 RepID=A0A323TAT2_9BACI|nr:hypothetical protein CR194_12725 [Salipaludibacillus keqinensis]